MTRKPREVRAWAVLLSGRLRDCGNGHEYQLPIFQHEDDALHWIARRSPPEDTPCIVGVRIVVEDKP